MGSITISLLSRCGRRLEVVVKVVRFVYELPTRRAPMRGHPALENALTRKAALLFLHCKLIVSYLCAYTEGAVLSVALEYASALSELVQFRSTRAGSPTYELSRGIGCMI